jgi:hypothetical protein
VSGLVHLARRFLGSLSPRPIDPSDDAWVRHRLLAGEQELWDRMSRPDRKHAAGVAREVDRLLGGAPRPVVAAAALHDVGKVESGLGTFARAGATVAAAVVDRRRAGGRLGSYLRHDVIGARLLEAAGADALTVAWAREHHLAPDRWTVPAEIGAALAAADDD